jgi:excinuclease UvrABC ATPase subunit
MVLEKVKESLHRFTRKMDLKIMNGMDYRLDLQKEGQIYLLDEPSLGLHKKDNSKLLSLFQHLVNRGNSVIIIEHNLDFIAASDWVIELGPGGGKQGGHIIFEGTPEEMLHAETLTAKWLGQRDRHRDPAR